MDDYNWLAYWWSLTGTIACVQWLAGGRRHDISSMVVFQWWFDILPKWRHWELCTRLFDARGNIGTDIAHNMHRLMHVMQLANRVPFVLPLYYSLYMTEPRGAIEPCILNTGWGAFLRPLIWGYSNVLLLAEGAITFQSFSHRHSMLRL